MIRICPPKTSVRFSLPRMTLRSRTFKRWIVTCTGSLCLQWLLRESYIGRIKFSRLPSATESSNKPLQHCENMFQNKMWKEGWRYILPSMCKAISSQYCKIVSDWVNKQVVDSTCGSALMSWLIMLSQEGNPSKKMDAFIILLSTDLALLISTTGYYSRLYYINNANILILNSVSRSLSR